jgi:hypothetical protein
MPKERECLPFPELNDPSARQDNWPNGSNFPRKMWVFANSQHALAESGVADIVFSRELVDEC